MSFENFEGKVEAFNVSGFYDHKKARFSENIFYQLLQYFKCLLVYIRLRLADNSDTESLLLKLMAL